MREARLVIFADYICPFCYLAEAVVDRLRSETRVDAGVAAFELTPPGTPLASPDEAWRRELWERSVEPLARELDVALEYPRAATRTRKAHEAVAYARGRGALEPMHRAVYDAYWKDGRDIGRIDVLVEIGRSIGLDATELKVALDIDQCTARVERDVERAARLGIRGVPAYLRQPEDTAEPIEDAPAQTAGVPPTAGLPALRLGVQRYEELREWVMAHDDV